MDRTAGARFGPYEILAPIGSGGMGEVYRALDSRLHREVALKILNSDGQEDTNRQRRFLQEARAASALNHPNILSVFDIGNENGWHFIVSELLEGESLRAVIDKGPMPLRRFLDIAIQIAAGLTAAHEAGIVHRDLKPENIIVGRDNRTKILDFGLAKVVLPETGSAEEQTRSHLLTMPGAIMGTVAYMSPEQARGNDVDFRSDQFSFGLILYEMATGKQAFHKDTPVQTLSAIITEDPPSITELNRKFPAPIRWMIERCLAKDRRDRYGATIDLHHELRDFRDHFSEASISGATAPSVSMPARRKTLLFTSLAIVAALIGGFLLAAYLYPGDNSATNRYQFTPFAVNPEPETESQWSPDGKTIAYLAEVHGQQQVFLRSLSSPTPVQVTNMNTEITSLFWSPDGSRFYFTGKGKDGKFDIWTLGVAGGSPEIFLTDAAGASISPDGKKLVFFRENADGLNGLSLWVASPINAEAKRYSRGIFKNTPFSNAESVISPDSSQVFLSIKSETSGSVHYILPLGDGEPRELKFLNGVETDGCVWLSDGKRLVISTGHGLSGVHLWLVDLDRETMIPITNGVGNELFPALSPRGDRILFSSVVQQYDLLEVPLDGKPPKYLTETPVNEKAPAWSPRGNQFAFVSDITGSDVIWVRSETEGWERPLVTAADFNDTKTASLSRPFFSPDGQRIVYHRNNKDGSTELWISSASGGTPIRVFEDSQHGQFTPVWSPDGNWIAFLTSTGHSYSLAKIRVGSSEPPTILKDKVGYFQPQWSPDGAWILVMQEKAMFMISPDGKTERQISDQPWLTGGWSSDSKTVYSIRQDESHELKVLATNIASGEEKFIVDAGIKQAFATDSPLVGFSMSRDGMSFATSVLRTKADLWILENFDPNPKSFWSRFSRKARKVEQ